jgi:hypothetical protein
MLPLLFHLLLWHKTLPFFGTQHTPCCNVLCKVQEKMRSGEVLGAPVQPDGRTGLTVNALGSRQNASSTFCVEMSIGHNIGAPMSDDLLT